MSTFKTGYYDTTAEGHAQLVADLTSFYDWADIITLNNYQTKFVLKTGAYIMTNPSDSAYATIMPVYDGNGNDTNYNLYKKRILFVKTEKSSALVGSATDTGELSLPTQGVFAITNGINALTGEEVEDVLVLRDPPSSTSYNYLNNIRVIDNTHVTSTHSSGGPRIVFNSVISQAYPACDSNSACTTENVLVIGLTQFADVLFGDVYFNGRKYFQAHGLLLKDF